MNETITITYITAVIYGCLISLFTMVVLAITGFTLDTIARARLRGREDRINELEGKLKFKDVIIKQLTDDLDYAKDEGKLEIIEEMDR